MYEEFPVFALFVDVEDSLHFRHTLPLLDLLLLEIAKIQHDGGSLLVTRLRASARQRICADTNWLKWMHSKCLSCGNMLTCRDVAQINRVRAGTTG